MPKMRNKIIPIKILVEIPMENAILGLDLKVIELTNLLEGKINFLNIQYSKISGFNKVNYLSRPDWDSINVNVNKIASISYDIEKYNVMKKICDIEDLLDEAIVEENRKNRLDKDKLKEVLEELYKRYDNL